MSCSAASCLSTHRSEQNIPDALFLCDLSLKLLNLKRFCCRQAPSRACVEAAHNAVLPTHAAKQYSSRPEICMTCGAGCLPLCSLVQFWAFYSTHAKRCSLFSSSLQGASKGAAVDRILKKLADEGNAPDFVLCIGDDRSDEDMFTAMEHVTFSPHLTTEVIVSPGFKSITLALPCVLAVHHSLCCLSCMPLCEHARMFEGVNRSNAAVEDSVCQCLLDLACFQCQGNFIQAG
jgi:hypothetical protein